MPGQKKSGNLLNEPRMYQFVKIIYLSVAKYILLQVLNSDKMCFNQDDILLNGSLWN